MVCVDSLVGYVQMHMWLVGSVCFVLCFFFSRFHNIRILKLLNQRFSFVEADNGLPRGHRIARAIARSINTSFLYRLQFAYHIFSRHSCAFHVHLVSFCYSINVTALQFPRDALHRLKQKRMLRFHHYYYYYCCCCRIFEAIPSTPLTYSVLLRVCLCLCPCAFVCLSISISLVFRICHFNWSWPLSQNYYSMQWGGRVKKAHEE